MKSSLKIISLALCFCAFTTQGVAQNPFLGGDSSGGSSELNFKFNSKTRVTLEFRNANVDAVLAMFQKASGITIVKDPSLTGPITVTSAGQVDLKTALKIIEKTLNLKGYDLKKDDSLLIISKRQDRNQGRGGSGFDMSALMQAGSGGGMPWGEQPQSVLKIYPIKFANASQVARVVNEAFANAQQSNPLQALFGGGGGGGFAGFGGQGGRGGRQQQGGGFNFASLGGRGQSTSTTVRASSDDYSNSLIVNAPLKEQGQVADVLKQIDKETDQPQRTKVFKLEFALASEVAPTVQNVLTNNAPRGRGGIGTQNVNPGDRFQQAARFGSAAASFGTVVADNRTNSLVVTATDESQLIIDTVVKQLDQKVEIQETTFVFPLNNARADDIANLINRAYGQRQGTNRNTNNATPNQQRGNTQGGGQRQGGGGGGGAGGNNLTEDPNNLFVQLQNSDATDGELETLVAVQQGGGFFGGGGGGFGQNRQTTAATTQQGRTADGRLAPVRDLTGQITTIPDPNTNSIIVVTNPDNAELIRRIIDQLDRIPEQVMIETYIVEATLDETNKLGVEWNYTSTGQFGTPGSTGTIGTNFNQANANPALTGLRYTLNAGGLTSFLNAIQTNSKFQVLSTPRIFTSNNVQAQINISQSIPYVLSTRQDVNGNLLFNYAFQDVGIVLTVTPRITANGYVTMDVNQTANELQGFTDFNAPIVNQREADTTVSVKDGEAVVLGGIIRNTVTASTNKIPILGDIPLLGNIFKTQSKTKGKTELLVLLRPRIVRDEDAARKLKDENIGRLSPSNQQEIGKMIPPDITKTEVKTKVDPPTDKKSGPGEADPTKDKKTGPGGK